MPGKKGAPSPWYLRSADWWEMTRRNPGYQDEWVAKDSPLDAFPTEPSKKLRDLGYTSVLRLNPNICADYLLLNDGVQRAIHTKKGERCPGPVLPEIGFSDIRPAVITFHPEALTSQNSLAFFFDLGPVAVALHVNPKRPVKSSAARAWTKPLSAQVEIPFESLADVQNDFPFPAPTLRRWTHFPIAVDWRLTQTEFLALMEDFYEDTIEKIQKLLKSFKDPLIARTQPRYPLTTWKVLAKIEKLNPLPAIKILRCPSSCGDSREAYVNKLEKLAEERHRLAGEEMPGSSKEAQMKKFRDTLKRCDLWELEPRPYQERFILKVRRRRLGDDYWSGKLNEGALWREIQGHSSKD
ncbi:MAG: hypothetical protein O7H41_15135 [Planctomycetota bacterium]|nr:hypothetical protein [Planctomycetota bacterium]